MKRRSDEEISAPLYAFDTEVRSQYGCFAGVDEAGRGRFAAPCAWRPAFWTRKTRCTASTILKS